MKALAWIQSTQPTEPPSDVYCQTRDIVQARVESVRLTLLDNGWDEATAALIVAVLGELTSNAFDHNIGQWPDVPGCWFEMTIGENSISVTVADRGQGVRSSLERVRPGIDDHTAMRIAFTEHVTGRAPEKRGNGLKFVLNALNELPAFQFTYQSGTAEFLLSGKSDPTSAEFSIVNQQMPVRGVIATINIQRL
ncbi:MAG: hypothetical protein AAB413_01640 [Patescibacteria group bacterium]